MATLLLFGPARTAAGTGRVVIEAATVGALLDAACDRLGPQLSAVLEVSAVWVNGSPADATVALEPADEVALVPPVSGGS